MRRTWAGFNRRLSPRSNKRLNPACAIRTGTLLSATLRVASCWSAPPASRSTSFDEQQTTTRPAASAAGWPVEFPAHKHVALPQDTHAAVESEPVCAYAGRDVVVGVGRVVDALGPKGVTLQDAGLEVPRQGDHYVTVCDRGARGAGRRAPRGRRRRARACARRAVRPGDRQEPQHRQADDVHLRRSQPAPVSNSVSTT